MIHSLGCRMEDEEDPNKEDINCHGSNIRVIRLPPKDMKPNRIRSFCDSQSIEISNQVHDEDETRLMNGAMKHQLHCQSYRIRKRHEAKLKGVSPIMVDKKDGSGLKSIGKIAGEKLKTGFKKYFTGGELTRKGKEELTAASEELKMMGTKADISKKEPEAKIEKPSVEPGPEIVIPPNGGTSGFTVTYTNPKGG